AIPRPITVANIMRDGCARMNLPNSCADDICFHKFFRTFDASCNNLNNSLRGAAFTPFVRLLPPVYDDGNNAVADSIRRERPNARLVSRALLSSRRAIASRASSMLMQFGQFLSHDMSKNKLDGQCTCDGGPECISIFLSPSDSRTHNAPCIPLKRAAAICGTGVGGIAREQMNANTAFIDASQVYGSDAISQRKFRAGFRSGLSMTPIGGRLFPPMDGRNTFHTGDDRSNLFVGLAALHTVFVRLHNKINTDLRHINRHWSENRLFQETRKIIGAMMQVITYKEFLPALLGSLHDTLIPRYTRYNPMINPGVSNEFAGAAYRLHGLIQEIYELRNRNFDVIGTTRFVESTFQVQRIISGGIDSLIRGLVSQPARLPQRITTQVTELLGGGMLDMASINIMRGRDHGFPTYNHYRRLCKLPPIISFDDWPEVSEVEVRERVKELYRNPEHIDLYVGGVIEDPIEGSILGPTFACIIADQFIRSRDGDRFYFENPDQFTISQIMALKRITLSSVLCETADDLPFLPMNVFIVSNQSVVPCVSIPSLDLTPWRE
uniref:peroxidase n=1 Tax=Parascaris univalens TaxID=6257 RepID=A0A915BCB8_PARUN